MSINYQPPEICSTTWSFHDSISPLPTSQHLSYSYPITTMEPPGYTLHPIMKYAHEDTSYHGHIHRARTFEDMGIPNPGSIKSEGICNSGCLKLLRYWKSNPCLGCCSICSYDCIRSVRFRVGYVGMREVTLKLPYWSFGISYISPRAQATHLP